MVTKACVGKLSAMRLAVALTGCLPEKAQAFDGEVLPAAVDSEVVSHSTFPSVIQPNAAVEAIATTQHFPEIDSSYLVTISQDELRTITWLGAMSAAPGTQPAGVVLWDERPQSSSVVGTNPSGGNSNQQTIGVTIQGY